MKLLYPTLALFSCLALSCCDKPRTESASGGDPEKCRDAVKVGDSVSAVWGLCGAPFLINYYDDDGEYQWVYGEPVAGDKGFYVYMKYDGIVDRVYWEDWAALKSHQHQVYGRLDINTDTDPSAIMGGSATGGGGQVASNHDVLTIDSGPPIIIPSEAGALLLVRVPDSKTNVGLPLMKIPSNNGKLIIDMEKFPNTAQPEHALIEIEGEHHCLVMYNDTCVIMGNHLEVW